LARIRHLCQLLQPWDFDLLRVALNRKSPLTAILAELLHRINLAPAVAR
jgi:hypothetical protein